MSALPTSWADYDWSDTDESKFRIDLPGALCALGNAEVVLVYRSALMVEHGVENHPALDYVAWYVQRRGLVALTLDQPFTGQGSETFVGGCLSSTYVTPARRLNAS